MTFRSLAVIYINRACAIYVYIGMIGDLWGQKRIADKNDKNECAGG